MSASDHPDVPPIEPELQAALERAAAEAKAPDARHPEPLALVIFGASGDLASRKILPALAKLAARGSLPEHFALVGVARREMGDEEFRKLCLEVDGARDNPRWAELSQCFRYVAGDYAELDTFGRLTNVLSEVDVNCGTEGNRVYYLATIPDLFATVARGLAAYKANDPGPGGTFARLVVEKPFGTDLASSRRLDLDLHDCFREEQIFRIDHYMGKETVQNVLALRFANTIFEPIWNRRYVDHVQVTVAEEIGVEHRGNFYESAGALRDIVQNHVMQVLSLTLMEPPSSMDPNAIRDEKVKLLRSVVIPSVDQEVDHVVRAQYVRGVVDGEEVLGYREEEGVDPNSTTETYVAMHLQVDNWRWAGVPLFVRTGKRLKKRETEVSMVFQRPPHLPFAGQLTRELQPDSLTLRIQPDEGISLSFGAKVPGPSFRVRSVAMDFSYREAFPGGTAEAYERLLLDAMAGDATLFIRSDEVQQAWQIVAPIQQSFAEGEPPLARYPAGSWGPVEADRLIEATGRHWRNP
ncbi:MAG: putative glucose-6-phosphate dehydrogenase [Acidimicrobiaceae bacterium]|nr:putative glucose-6-phosphate dehydrogenase [Acidimicrobiaceae bacterium]